MTAFKNTDPFPFQVMNKIYEPFTGRRSLPVPSLLALGGWVAWGMRGSPSSCWQRCCASIMSPPGSLEEPPVINSTRSTLSAWDGFEERLMLPRPVNLLLMNCLQQYGKQLKRVGSANKVRWKAYIISVNVWYKTPHRQYQLTYLIMSYSCFMNLIKHEFLRQGSESKRKA